mmetsp:Transcript_106621/g.270772  ORF Transcript_106621/g.270772 Transcript_106621/m.270772 type:complete len:215 (-) Transcript_106621:1152-1796(-)
MALQLGLLLLWQALLEAGDDLHDAVPHLVGDRVWSTFQHPENHVHVPAEVRRVALREDGDLEHELLLEKQVAVAQDLQELVHDLLPVFWRAQRVEQVQRLPTDRDVRLVHLLQDQVLVPLQVLVHGLHDRQPSHGLQTEVSNVRVRGGDECAEEASRGPQRVWVTAVPELDHEVHCLEEDRVFGVRAVLPFGIRLASLLHRRASGGLCALRRRL